MASYHDLAPNMHKTVTQYCEDDKKPPLQAQNFFIRYRLDNYAGPYCATRSVQRSLCLTS